MQRCSKRIILRRDGILSWKWHHILFIGLKMCSFYWQSYFCYVNWYISRNHVKRRCFHDLKVLAKNCNYVFRTSKGTVHSFCFRDHPYMRSPQFSNCLTPTLPFLPGIAYGVMTPWGDVAPSSLYPIARIFRSKRRGL